MRLRRAAHVAWRRVGDETVLIHLQRKRIYVLNPSGGFFWHRLDGTRDGSKLVAELALDEAPPEDAGRALEEFLELLRSADLVEPPEIDESDESDETPVTSSNTPEYPFGSFVPPELVWQEDIRNFGQSCAFMSGASPACDTIPTS